MINALEAILFEAFSCNNKHKILNKLEYQRKSKINILSQALFKQKELKLAEQVKQTEIINNKINDIKQQRLNECMNFAQLSENCKEA